MKIGIILGTRPEIIKLSSVIRACQNNEVDFFIIHTNQHYSANMDAVFFEELELPAPKYNLGIVAGQHGEMVGKQLEAIEKILMEEKPDWILVQGDTNTVMAGALAASKLGIKIGHVEAGLRSYDRSMPEEINRIVTDHLSDLLFAPTEKQAKILAGEGIAKEKIVVTGNTIVDAVWQNLKLAKEKGVWDKIKNDLGEKWILLTSHRPSNVDVKENLETIMKAAKEAGERWGAKVVFPIHPRTKKNLENFGIAVDEEVMAMIEPVGYLEMLSLIGNAVLVMTDSGGIQEEACILGVPSVTLRENTERPETLEVGASVLVGGGDKEKILRGVEKMMSKNDEKWQNPFGDGKSGERVIERVLE